MAHFTFFLPATWKATFLCVNFAVISRYCDDKLRIYAPLSLPSSPQLSPPALVLASPAGLSEPTLPTHNIQRYSSTRSVEWCSNLSDFQPLASRNAQDAAPLF